MHYVGEKLNTNGDYKNSPKNTDYVEFELRPNFSEEEKEDIEDYDTNFKNIILVPTKYLVY